MWLISFGTLGGEQESSDVLKSRCLEVCMTCVAVDRCLTPAWSATPQPPLPSKFSRALRGCWFRIKGQKALGNPGRVFRLCQEPRSPRDKTLGSSLGHHWLNIFVALRAAERIAGLNYLYFWRGLVTSPSDPSGTVWCFLCFAPLSPVLLPTSPPLALWPRL